MIGSVSPGSSGDRVEIEVGGIPGGDGGRVFSVQLHDGAAGSGASLSVPRSSVVTQGILEVLRVFDSPGMAERILPSLCAGYLSSGFVHRLNNLLVGVVGNLDLASFYEWKGVKAEASAAEAKDSALQLADILRDLQEISECVHDGGPAWKGLGAVEGAAGRSIRVSIDWPRWVHRHTAACMGASAACLIGMAGTGSIVGRSDGSILLLEWKCEGNANGSACCPAPVPLMIALASLAMFHNGGSTVVEHWSGNSGKLVLRGDDGSA